MSRGYMINESIYKIQILFNDSDLDLEERDQEAQKLLNQLRKLDEVEDVNRVLDPNPPDGNKELGGFLAGMLTAEVNPSNIKALFGFLGDRLSGKTIELNVEANGKKLSVKAKSQAELMAAIKAAKEFLGE